MKTLVIEVDDRTEFALRSRANSPEESPEKIAARLLAEIFPKDEEDVEPDWVKALDPESRARHREIRALNRRLGLGGRMVTDEMFDRDNHYPTGYELD